MERPGWWKNQTDATKLKALKGEVLVPFGLRKTTTAQMPPMEEIIALAQELGIHESDLQELMLSDARFLNAAILTFGTKPKVKTKVRTRIALRV